MTMVYKTIMLQLYRPSRRKCGWIDTALLHYSQALQILMDRYQDEIEELARSETRVTQRLLLGLIDREASRQLNDYGVQPFKDSLKIEFASLAATYIGQKRSDFRAGYPSTFLDASCYDSAVSGCIARFDGGQTDFRTFGAECSKLIYRAGKTRSLYFGRYAANRDYCLLYDEFKDRFYAKLHLLNSSDRYYSTNASSSLSLRYVMNGMPHFINKPGKKRYIIVPLAFGKKQYGELKKALKDPALLHTARLVRRENRYYLMVNMACQPGPVMETVTTMGVSRNPFGGLSYTVCDSGGECLKQDRISAQGSQSSLLYTQANKIAEIALKNRSQVILESGGGKNDLLPVPQKDASGILSCRQYGMLNRILNYKLPEKGLPKPIEVSPNGLFLTCPHCQNRTRRNKISEELFACIECGYASESEWLGSENLARRLLKYRQDKIPILVVKQEQSLLFYNSSLNFEYLLPRNAEDYKPMYEELNRYVHSLGGEFQNDSKKYVVWKKLQQLYDVKEAVRLIFK